MIGSSSLEVFHEIGAPKNFAKFTEKKRKETIKRLQHRYFPVNVAKFLRTPILKNICQRQLLYDLTLWFKSRITPGTPSVLSGNFDFMEKIEANNLTLP